jgi:hypothetical protein
VMWMFPTTLYTRTRPARLLLDLVRPVFLNVLCPLRVCTRCEGKEAHPVNRIRLPKLQPFRTCASRTASHELQHPPSGGSPP